MEFVFGKTKWIKTQSYLVVTTLTVLPQGYLQVVQKHGEGSVCPENPHRWVMMESEQQLKMEDVPSAGPEFTKMRRS
jgi:hypothetical protein